MVSHKKVRGAAVNAGYIAVLVVVFANNAPARAGSPAGTGRFTAVPAVADKNSGEKECTEGWSRPENWKKTASDPEKLDAYRCPKPEELAIVFSWGYGGDHMPQERELYERMVVKAKKAGFNVIHGTYTPERLEILRRHSMKLMIDFLDVENHHVYKSIEKARAVAAAVEGDPAVWGYNVWNDHMRGREAGRERDIRTVRAWDPSHPSYAGGCSNDNNRILTNADVMGYYDFHWRRGIHLHFPHLLFYCKGAQTHNSYPYTWLYWRPVKWTDYYHSSRWSAHTAVACGMKGFLWFLAPMDHTSLEWHRDAGHIFKVNRELLPLKDEIIKIGLPYQVYATPITRSRENRELPAEQAGKPPGPLEGHRFPADFWIQPAAGEIVMGVFRYQDGTAAIYVVNYNAKADQRIKLNIKKAVDAEIFNRTAARFTALEIKNSSIAFPLEAAEGVLIRFKKQ